MASIKRFEEIFAWQKAKELVREVYRVCGDGRSSALEVQALLYVAGDLHYINEVDFKKLYDPADETVSLIAGFTAYLRRSSTPDRRTPNSELLTPNPELLTPDS